ncbi:HAMP domain-containing sensor histidine kinase [Fusibacter ferrireducens]|uniref:histidine kinase n=1 Tax=Fusibacter ferrireducens TaxID=2785058 RepID=A0ABR9ZP50_9FIRM|nr:HAMP domain-containing sensor histidine kinase [Fusibacter ferrireducens]MBF4691908.1 HAMP domain-containing histidine kinase [Fusibacter ferrireducens]
MTKLRFGIFEKIFLYTLLCFFLTITVTLLVFAQQAKEFYEYLQVQQYTAIFESLKASIDQNDDIIEAVKMADSFHDKNQSISFSVETQDGTTIYTTVNSDLIHSDHTQNINVQSSVKDTSANSKGDTKDGITIALDDNLLVRTLSVTVSSESNKKFIENVVFTLVLLLGVSIVGAVLFAKGITRPIKKLAADTHKMSCLEAVSYQETRKDEVGQLTKDVYNMYEKLKYTISELQLEIIREKEMEENQRYFFSAASHELKTPISAVSALLEGMLAGIGDYDNHPKYLRKCLEMTRTQSRIVNEILEIVKLSDERIVPQKEQVFLLKTITTLLLEYNTLADRKEQNIIVNVPESISCYTDRKMISTVLSNVIMNAIQNSSKNEEIRIWTETHASDQVRLCILNTNSKIDDETKNKLYEPFYRADQARSPSDKGGGLGLTIVKKILDSLEITFSLETKGHDVIFFMDLPIHD